MCELNVIEQMTNVCRTNIILDAWKRGQPVSVHGWIYGLNDGLLRNLSECFSAPEDIEPNYQNAVIEIKKRVAASVQKDRAIYEPVQQPNDSENQPSDHSNASESSNPS